MLEVGAGRAPAIVNPGTIFTEEGAEYTAIDAQGVYEPRRCNLLGKYERLLAIDHVIADASDMPFEGARFSHVIYRSVFGAYTPSEDDLRQGIPYRPHERGWQGSTWENTLASISESYRVLKPNGVVCIAEEDTPIRKKYLISELARVGFTGITKISSGLLPNPTFIVDRPDIEREADTDWLQARGKFWSNRDKMTYGNGQVPAYAMRGSYGLRNTPYILQATKP